MGDKRCGENMAEGVEMQANRTTSVLHNGMFQQIDEHLSPLVEGAFDVYESSAAASATSSFSAALSESCISEVQRVRLSRSSCIISVESL